MARQVRGMYPPKKRKEKKKKQRPTLSDILERREISHSEPDSSSMGLVTESGLIVSVHVG